MFFKQMIIKNVNKIAVNIGEAYNSPWGKSKSFGDLIGLTITGALTIAGVVALFLIIGGGIFVIASAGKSDPQGAAKGKSAVTMGVVGFIIVMSAYWVIRVIEIISGVKFVTAPAF